MIDKINVVAFCPQSFHNPLPSTLLQMPRYVAEELDGDCQNLSVNLFKAWWMVLSHASDIHVLVLEDDRKAWYRLGKWYRWINPSGKVVTLREINELLLHEKQYSADWTEENYRLWVNRVLLPQIGFKPLAEIWES